MLLKIVILEGWAGHLPLASSQLAAGADMFGPSVFRFVWPNCTPLCVSCRLAVVGTHLFKQLFDRYAMYAGWPLDICNYRHSGIGIEVCREDARKMQVLLIMAEMAAPSLSHHKEAKREISDLRYGESNPGRRGENAECWPLHHIGYCYRNCSLSAL